MEVDYGFRRDIALFRWGVDSIDQLLDRLGLQYRDRPRTDVLSGTIVIVGARAGVELSLELRDAEGHSRGTQKVRLGTAEKRSLDLRVEPPR